MTYVQCSFYNLSCEENTTLVKVVKGTSPGRVIVFLLDSSSRCGASFPKDLAACPFEFVDNKQQRMKRGGQYEVVERALVAVAIDVVATRGHVVEARNKLIGQARSNVQLSLKVRFIAHLPARGSTCCWCFQEKKSK
jgi:hypothetical protein